MEHLVPSESSRNWVRDLGGGRVFVDGVVVGAVGPGLAAECLQRGAVLGARRVVDEDVDGGVDVGERLLHVDEEFEGVFVLPTQA